MEGHDSVKGAGDESGGEALERGQVVPRGMGNLLCMAAEEDGLRQALLDERDTVVDRCAGLLSDDEQRVLRSVPRSQLEQMLDRLRSSPQPRRDFLQAAAKAVVALLAGASMPMWLVDAARPAVAQFTRGIRPDIPETEEHTAVFEGKGWFVFDVVPLPKPKTGAVRGVRVTVSSDVGTAGVLLLVDGWRAFKKGATNFTEAARVTGKRDRIMAEVKGQGPEGGTIRFLAEHWLKDSIFVDIETGEQAGAAMLLPQHLAGLEAAFGKVDAKL